MKNTNLLRKKCQNKLVQIINNDEYYKENSKEAGGKKNVPNPNFSHALVFVFDLSSTESFITTRDYVKAFLAAESSTRDELKLK